MVGRVINLSFWKCKSEYQFFWDILTYQLNMISTNDLHNSEDWNIIYILITPYSLSSSHKHSQFFVIPYSWISKPVEYYWKSQLLSTSIHKYTQRLFVTINLVQCIKSYIWTRSIHCRYTMGWDGISLDRALMVYIHTAIACVSAYIFYAMKYIFTTWSAKASKRYNALLQSLYNTEQTHKFQIGYAGECKVVWCFINDFHSWCMWTTLRWGRPQCILKLKRVSHKTDFI